MKIFSFSTKKILVALAIILILAVSGYKKLQFLNKPSKDISAYEDAIVDILGGVNPYIKTIKSYENIRDPGGHGYAYLPGFLYLYAALFIVHLLTGFSHIILWKIPLIIADIGIGALLVKYFWNRDKLALIFALLIWYFNPYAYFRRGYITLDAVPILFMFLSLWYLEKDDVVAGALFSLSVIFKTFPIILFPIFLIKSKNKLQFLIAGAMVAFLFFIPFFRSFNDFITMLNGSLFVHSERIVQGRPFLFYISYFYKIELFRIIPLKIYSYMAIFFGWVLILIGYFLFKIKEKYTLSVLSFANFYLFTPVLNRTYLLWFLPLFIISCFEISKKRKYIFYVTLTVFYIFMSWYLIQWEDGFEVWHP